MEIHENFPGKNIKHYYPHLGYCSDAANMPLFEHKANASTGSFAVMRCKTSKHSCGSKKAEHVGRVQGGRRVQSGLSCTHVQQDIGFSSQNISF